MNNPVDALGCEPEISEKGGESDNQDQRNQVQINDSDGSREEQTTKNQQLTDLNEDASVGSEECNEIMYNLRKKINEDRVQGSNKRKRNAKTDKRKHKSSAQTTKANSDVHPKYQVGTRVQVRHHVDADYSHGNITSFNTDLNDAKYLLSFNPEDELEDTTYNEKDVERMVMTPVKGLGGDSFLPYRGLRVEALRYDSNESEIAIVWSTNETGAVLKYPDHGDTLSGVHIPFNLMKPKDKVDTCQAIPNQKESPYGDGYKIDNVGQHFIPYSGMTVLVFYNATNYPAKIVKVENEGASVQFSDDLTEEFVTYLRMQPILDVPRTNRERLR